MSGAAIAISDPFVTPPTSITGERLSRSARPKPLYDWHVLYTRYLQRVNAGQVGNISHEELEHAEAVLRWQQSWEMWAVQTVAELPESFREYFGQTPPPPQQVDEAGAA